MITRIEIDGFKTFQEFSVDLAPFQVIIGQNGSGKSNLFYALRLLALIPDQGLDAAFNTLSDEVGELFSRLPNGETTNVMAIAVEMLVDRFVEDNLGRKDNLPHRRLRYEMGIARRKDEHGLFQLHIIHEELSSIPEDKDSWKQYHAILEKQYSEVANNVETFISTANELRVIHFDETFGSRRRNRKINVYSDNGLLLSVANSYDTPHALAVLSELRKWRLLRLDPDKMREPGPRQLKAGLLPDGSNLPTVLAWREPIYPGFLTDISHDMGVLIPSIRRVRSELDEVRQQYNILIETRDNRRFWARELSDGTLCLLAMVSMANDPEHRGVVFFEEPEFGIHPGLQKQIVPLLQNMTTDFADSDQSTEPLKQLLVATQSPVLVSPPEITKSLLFAELVTRVGPGKPPMQVTRMTPVNSDVDGDRGHKAYTLSQVLKYLNSVDTESVRTELYEATH